jgi:anhydro-N-acetylmuramic acid kinase
MYVGLMSGTSMDSIDAVLLSVEAAAMRLRATSAHAWPAALQARLRHAAEHPKETSIAQFGALDAEVAEEFATAARQLLHAARVDTCAVRAIGSHGQTILHQPRGSPPFTLQIGDPNILAERLGIDVVADFRRRDVAAGGEGAPLMSAFHLAAFGQPGQTRAVVNIGGIANVTLLQADGSVLGFDTGPGNCLLDSWARRSLGLPLDRNGAWAASGAIDASLLKHMLADPYFALAPPKSTGRDTFSDPWLAQLLGSSARDPADVQATLAELTARTIAAAITAAAPTRLLVCGGGAFNAHLMRRLSLALPAVELCTTAEHGIAPEHVEAAGFAWLAHQFLSGLPGNIPSVTGARHPVPLGGLYRGSPLQQMRLNTTATM